jgi:enterochelin esterase-like enzyme
MTTKTSLISPRLIHLQHDLETGQVRALDLFWQDTIEQGTPLIEALPGDEKHMLVTFLWKDPGGTHNVVVTGGPTRWGDFAKNQMVRLLETNLWYKTYQVRSDMRTTYQLSLNDSLLPLSEVEDWNARTATFQTDPLNPHRYVFPQDEEEVSSQEGAVSVFELPNAPPQPWIVPQTTIPKGLVEMYRLHSNILKNERRVWVYTPPGYEAHDEPYGLLILFDGFAYMQLVPTPTILDNLLSEERIPPLIAVMLDSIDGETRMHELACNPSFVDFLTKELLPWVHEHYSITTDPTQTVVGGSSAGGLAAAFAGLKAPEAFGNILSQSGAFWWDRDPENWIAQEWLAQQYVTSPLLPLCFYLEVGLLERTSNDDQILSNRHLHDILRAKGYEVHYSEFNGGHDYLCWRGSLADGLLTLLSKS